MIILFIKKSLQVRNHCRDIVLNYIPQNFRTYSKIAMH